MGSKCCTERKDETNPAKQGRQSIAAFGKGGGKQISIGYHSRGDDAEKFDKAFESNDLKGFVALLGSGQIIESFDERMHPWAEDPKTIGALAGTQLAILASEADKDNPMLKEEIFEAGAVQPLVEYLRSDDQPDRVQTAVVALSFLTAECSKVANAAYKGGAMPLLLKHLDSPVGGMRAAAATTLRNICMESEEYRGKFMDLGGMRGLVQQLDPKPDPVLNHTDVQLEAVLNFQDMIENEEGHVITKYALLAIKNGAEEKLKKLMESPDEEVKNAAEDSLSALTAVKKT